MNTQEEIKTQFQFNCFGKLYAYLSSSLIRWGGTKGERLVRQVIVQYAQEKGAHIRQHQEEKGISINLKNLFLEEPCCGADPRFYRVNLRDTRQSQLQEVYSCPLEKQWRALNEMFAGSLYCEEYAHALIKGYTLGRGQANVSNSLTCSRDNRCVQAFYYRTANMTPQQQWELENGTEASPERNTGRNMLCLYHAFYENIKDQGVDGIAALACGLRAFAKDIICAVSDEASRTGRAVDETFMDEFLPVPYNHKILDNTTSFLEDTEKKIFEINIVEQIQATFAL